MRRVVLETINGDWKTLAVAPPNAKLIIQEIDDNDPLGWKTVNVVEPASYKPHLISDRAGEVAMAAVREWIESRRLR